MKFKLLILPAFLFCLSFTANAQIDEVITDLPCLKPRDTAPIDTEHFRQEQRNYLNCLSEFIEEQQNKIVAHEQAMYRALKEWENADIELTAAKP